jgi:eukaryotic-like serine/threonine-protein kinase
MLQRLVHAQFLVSTDSPQTERVRPLLEAGSIFAGAKVVACIQAFEDTDVYQVETSEGAGAALKIVRPGAGPEVASMLDREAFVLTHLDATVNPALLAFGTENEIRYLMLSWCQGYDCASAAAALRAAGDHTALLRLSVAILDAYARLHAQNVVHSDIHPRNILVDNSYSVRIIDFGLARVAGVENEFRRSERGGVGYFFEPEYASAVREGHRPPCSSMLGEQYALAALVYSLISGKHYVDFSLEKDAMLRQISEDGPLPFQSRGLRPWPALEEVLAKALAKDSAARFLSVAAFATALGCVGEPPALAAARSDPGLVSHTSARETLTRALDRLDANAPLLHSGITASPRGSVTFGSAGVACALHRIACAFQDPKILALADVWGERAARDARLDDAWYSTDIEISPETVGRVSPYHTESGVSFIKALIAHSMGDVLTQQIALDSFVAQVSSAACPNPDVTLGRSGTLLASSQLLAALGPGSLVRVAALRELGSSTVASIWQQLDSYPPALECREISYTGIAHGWAGIIYATLCWCRAANGSLPLNVDERLNQLAAIACHSGRHARWSWSVGPGIRGMPDTFMSGWCNGTAGQVFLWLAAHYVLKEDRYLVLAEKAAWHAAETDTFIGNLCCGLAGQAYALLAVYRCTGDKAWLHSAQALAEKAAVAFRNIPAVPQADLIALRPDSLYKGELGVAVLAADLENPDASAMPAFEFVEF